MGKRYPKITKASPSLIDIYLRKASKTTIRKKRLDIMMPLTLYQLQAYAKVLNLSNYSKLRKINLINLLIKTRIKKGRIKAMPKLKLRKKMPKHNGALHFYIPKS